jgi:hypothetical protein
MVKDREQGTRQRAVYRRERCSIEGTVQDTKKGTGKIAGYRTLPVSTKGNIQDRSKVQYRGLG